MDNNLKYTNFLKHFYEYHIEKLKYWYKICIILKLLTWWIWNMKWEFGKFLINTVSVFGYFCPKLSKSVQYDLWLFQLFLAFFNSLYQELSGYVSHISLVLHIYPQEVQEHRPFCSFACKIKFLLLAQVGKKVKNFNGAHMCTLI